MTQAKHTPGPWTVRGQYVEAAKHAVVAQVNMPYEIGSDAAVSVIGVMNANAELIAAAPELLELLQESTYFMTFDKGSVCIRVDYMKKQDELRRRINALIAKVGGAA